MLSKGNRLQQWEALEAVTSCCILKFAAKGNHSTLLSSYQKNNLSIGLSLTGLVVLPFTELTLRS